MRVALTGSSGFIGRHVLRALLAQGAEVVAISRHPDPPLTAAVTPLALDIGNVRSNAFEGMGRPDALLHLAWGGLPNYRSNGHLNHQLPLHKEFLDACIDSGLPKIVVAGTCLEYGLQSNELSETITALPSTAYAEAKHQLHQHLLTRLTTHNFDLGWLRLFYLYGAGQAATSLYSQLRVAVASGVGNFDMSSGNQIRDFLAIEIAAAQIAALTMRHTDIGTVNICSGRPTTVIETVRGWLQEWNTDIHLNRGVYTYPDYESFAFWGSTRRLNSLLGTK